MTGDAGEKGEQVKTERVSNSVVTVIVLSSITPTMSVEECPSQRQRRKMGILHY